MNLRHVEQMNRLAEVLNQLNMFPPEATLASQVVYEHHKSLKKVGIDNFRLVFWRHINRYKLLALTFLVKVVIYILVSWLLGYLFLSCDR